MECEHGLIVPAFRLMAPSLLINDDTCYAEDSQAETSECFMFKWYISYTAEMISWLID